MATRAQLPNTEEISIANFHPDRDITMTGMCRDKRDEGDDGDDGDREGSKSRGTKTVEATATTKRKTSGSIELHCPL